MSRIEVVGNLGYRYLTLSPALYVSQPSTQVNFYLKYEEIFKQKFVFNFLSKSQIFSKGIESLPQQLISYSPMLQNSVRSKSPSFQHQRFLPSGCKHIGIRKFEFVTTTQFLCLQMPMLSIRQDLPTVVVKKAIFS